MNRASTSPIQTLRSLLAPLNRNAGQTRKRRKRRKRKSRSSHEHQRATNSNVAKAPKGPSSSSWSSRDDRRNDIGSSLNSVSMEVDKDEATKTGSYVDRMMRALHGNVDGIVSMYQTFLFTVLDTMQRKARQNTRDSCSYSFSQPLHMA